MNGYPTDGDVAGQFVRLLADMDRPTVLELGTLRWEETPTHHLAWAPHCTAYVMSDVEAGPDVDVVADAHDLAPFADGSFDAVISCSVWEHLARPWIAAQALARVLRPGGIAYIATHQTFPIHGYPSDYFRFSTEALDLLFTDAGLVPLGSEYVYPCTITPPAEVTRWNLDAAAWLNVAGTYRKSC